MHNPSLLGGCSPSFQLSNDVIKLGDHVQLLGVTIAVNLGLYGRVSTSKCVFSGFIS